MITYEIFYIDINERFISIQMIYRNRTLFFQFLPSIS